MTIVLSQMPGQVVTIVHQILNADGYRVDGYSPSGSGLDTAPVIARVVLPNFTLASNFPVQMIKLDAGLYSYNIQIPHGAISVGLYIVDIYWYHPDTFSLQQDVVLINITAPFGIYNATVNAVVP